MDRNLLRRRKPEEEEKNIIELRGLKQIFNEGQENEYRLFDGFDLSIPDIPGQSQVISIMGQSGCGKTCLARLLSGLSEVQEGTVKIEGNPKSVPMVFQQAAVYEWLSVVDNVALPMWCNGVSKKEAREKAMELLKLIGLEEHAEKYAKTPELSGGQLQRVSIGRCLACDSNLMILDEATGSLDIKTKREIQNLILQVAKKKENMTILNITHSIEEAARISDVVIVLKSKPCTIYKILELTDKENKMKYVDEIREIMNEL